MVYTAEVCVRVVYTVGACERVVYTVGVCVRVVYTVGACERVVYTVGACERVVFALGHCLQVVYESVGGGWLKLPGDAVVVRLPDPADGRDVGLHQVVLRQVWEDMDQFKLVQTS